MPNHLETAIRAYWQVAPKFTWVRQDFEPTGAAQLKWDIWPGVKTGGYFQGDCDDLVTCMDEACRDMGIPTERLTLLAVEAQLPREGHLILVLRGETGKFVIADSRRPVAIYPIEEMSHVKMAVYARSHDRFRFLMSWLARGNATAANVNAPSNPGIATDGGPSPIPA